MKYVIILVLTFVLLVPLAACEWCVWDFAQLAGRELGLSISATVAFSASGANGRNEIGRAPGAYDNLTKTPIKSSSGGAAAACSRKHHAEHDASDMRIFVSGV